MHYIEGVIVTDHADWLTILSLVKVTTNYISFEASLGSSLQVGKTDNLYLK